MDIQLILVIVVFALALAYIVRSILRSVSPKKNNCASGCGKCAANFPEVPQQK